MPVNLQRVGGAGADANDVTTSLRIPTGKTLTFEDPTTQLTAMGALASDGSVPMTGLLNMDGNSLLDVGVISAIDGEYSVDVSARSLYDPLGSQVLDWANPGLLSVLISTEFAEPATFVNGFEAHQALTLFQNSDISFNGPFGYVGKFSTNGTDALGHFDDVGVASVLFNGRQLVGFTGVTVVDWFIGTLNDLDNGFVSVDWGNRSLYNSTSAQVLSWGLTGITMGLGMGIQFAPQTVASLGSASGLAGMRRFVTNATATTFGTVVVGGGSNAVPVYSDGTNWRIG